jgi:uncharacterized protein YbjT (DUF2867 family)
MSQQGTTQWDLGRFVKTLSYFGAIPILSRLDWFQQWLGSRPDPKADCATLAYEAIGGGMGDRQSQAADEPTHDLTGDLKRSGVILVVGATGGVGKRVVKRLIEQGYRARSLVRDGDRAKAILGDILDREGMDIVEADLTLAATLTAAVTDDISAVICCSGTRVQPVEGDTPTREKYYQGIKFYLPEVVDIPEQVEYQGIQNLVQAINGLGLTRQPLFDFTQPSSDIKETWGALDDVVMGGVSESSLRLADAVAYFSGTVSTANSGGFASVRTRNFDQAIDLSPFDGVELRVKGDGKRYKFMLRTETRWDGIAHSYSFDTVPDTWITVRIPFSAFVPVFRAKTVDNAPIDPSRVHAFQLMLSKFEYDGALNPKFDPGFFQLQVESIQAYRQADLPKFVLVSSAGVTRPGQPGLNLDEEPPAVRMNDQLGGILTWKRRGEEVVQQSGIPYAIIRPCAMTEEPGGQPLHLEQGDRLKGKVSRDDVADLCIAALSHPQVCNTTFEVANAADAPGHSRQDWDALFNNAALQPDRVSNLQQ